MLDHRGRHAQQQRLAREGPCIPRSAKADGAGYSRHLAGRAPVAMVLNMIPSGMCSVAILRSRGTRDNGTCTKYSTVASARLSAVYTMPIPLGFHLPP